ncbi:hypothetical protein GALL_396090 [mine drainage metagenome]|uniref:Uncharacterized protein n=1 Tax=mine drainage metagenome TaxID=410659 RepID=A0A1J5QMD9_9ZZZZ
MELVEVDHVDAETRGRGLDGLLEVLGTTVLGPGAVAGTQVPALGRDEDAAGVAAVGAERARDQALVVADVGRGEVIGVRGVDERDAGVESGVDGGDRLALVGPALDRHRHPAEPDRADGPVTDGALLHAALFLIWCSEVRCRAGASAGPSPRTSVRTCCTVDAMNP